MTSCLKKNKVIDTKEPHFVESFTLCGNMLMNEPILTYPELNKLFTLTTDA